MGKNERPCSHTGGFQKEHIDLYMYYRENYEYRPIKNWTDLPRAQGFLDVQVDGTWFPTRSTTNKTWTLYGYYLPSGLDPTAELTNPASQYPRPFNFSVVRK